MGSITTTNWNPLMHEETYVRRRAVPNSHISSVIFCHANGQKGNDWLYIVDRLRSLAHLDHVAFIFPYLDYADKTNPERNEHLVQTIIADEIKKGIPASHIAVGGFGEGGAVALSAVLSDDATRIAGVAGIALAGTDEGQILSRRTEAQGQTPVLVTSRDSDGGAVTGFVQRLQATGQPVEVNSHDIVSLGAEEGPLAQKELENLAIFLQKVLPVEKQHNT